MASKETWEKIAPYFKPHSTTDNWGDVDAISDEHLLRLYDFRTWLGLPIIITAGVKSSGHAANSYHYSRKDKSGKEIGACATDIIIPDYDATPYDLVLDASRFGFTGIGYYPHWKYNGKMVGGLHVDSRPLKRDKDGTQNYSHSRWMGVLIEGKQQYVGLNFHNMLMYCNEDMPIDVTQH